MATAMITWTNEREGCTEASDIGLKPGQWPAEITVDGLRLKKHAVIGSGDFLVVHYRTDDGRTVAVFND